MKNTNAPKSDYEINLDLNNLAPIAISVYSRLNHFQNCIESLLLNDLSKHSVLYIFSDAAKPGDENMVLKVRKYAQSINGFKKVNLVFQKKNYPLKNITKLMRLPLELNGKSIILEDDVIVQKSFLKFMNLSLNFYENHEDIFCVSGYVGPENSSINKNIIQAYQIFNGSGFGIWKKKYYDYLDDYKKCHPWLRFKKNILYSIRFCFYFGLNNYLNYKLMYDKNSFHDDQLIGEYLYRKKKLSLIPPFSLTLNKGHDGSGLRCENMPEIQNEVFLKYSDRFVFTVNFNNNQVHSKTQKTLKYKGYKPHFIKQIYYAISIFFTPPKVLVNWFKKIF